MELFYPIVIVILFLLSIFDLIVGLINDAVNFLNSAIGSKVASRKIIMIFSSLGILLGAFLSSGMMEVARKGVFDPSYFYFSDILFIFLSVMISDIILLDVFNTFGLPTSTTVSMVFCLFGGAFSIAMIKIILNHEPFHYLNQYVKAEKILSISIGIFLSIIISFISGSFIHYFIRLFFSFNYENRLRSTGLVWAAISLSCMTYFLIVRGMHSTFNGDGFFNKNLSVVFFLMKNFVNWINDNFFTFFLILFSTWIIVAKIFLYLEYNILKFVVLYGTFSLAMAFSGNDLVNFVGIPIASMQSYNIWKENGFPPSERFNMHNLSKNVHVPYSVLICSSIIMILTLWFSKKTKNITITELTLSNQNKEYTEKFLSNSFSRGIVRFFLYFGKKFFKLFPKRFLVKIEKNFQNKNITKKENIYFDLVRASANLTISSILISIATVKKLPLSTTFVTFMVSMGTSLSDRAWDRESAVDRVSGVLKVIRGWIFTGLIAFTMAGLVATFLYFFKYLGLFCMICFIAFIFYKSYKNYCKGPYKHNKKEKLLLDIVNLTLENAINEIFCIIYPTLEYIESIYDNSIKGITMENLKVLKKNRNTFLKVKKNFIKLNISLIKIVKITQYKDRKHPIAGIFCLHIYNKTKKIIQSSDVITNNTLFHVINSHNPLKFKQKEDLMALKYLMLKHFNIIKKIIVEKNCENEKMHFTSILKNKIINKIEEQINQQVIGIINDKYGIKNTFLILDILLESKNIAKNVEDIMILYCKIIPHIIKNK
ncbi:inorganic phosphate transporter [Blattabacterium cuenoti]|uniref:inorganic phosphate transporter n=1 Tax=Blattabacterium cuenoti TaxID=1653831 RepID=UPI00163B9C06|nr:inorganic phosphate transporter [Blattabacterium cuenoti]